MKFLGFPCRGALLAPLSGREVAMNWYCPKIVGEIAS